MFRNNHTVSEEIQACVRADFQSASLSGTVEVWRVLCTYMSYYWTKHSNLITVFLNRSAIKVGVCISSASLMTNTYDNKLADTTRILTLDFRLRRMMLALKESVLRIFTSPIGLASERTREHWAVYEIWKSVFPHYCSKWSDSHSSSDYYTTRVGVGFVQE